MSHPISGDRLKELFRTMLLIRRFEEQAGLAYQMKKFSGFCHLYIGQEATGVGALAALEDRDYVIGTYREHGQAIARGINPKHVMAELFGKKTGCTGGMGGSMHLYDVEKRFMGGWGIVGGHVPMAAGLAFAAKYKEEDSVCLCFFGEGSIHQGVFHETMNMAAMWELPLVCVVENNMYAMGTSVQRQTSVVDVHNKAKAYGISHSEVDGQDLRKVYDAVKDAVDHARAGNGPYVLESKTYRFRGHSMSDPAKYRTKSEVKEKMKRDPLHVAREWVVDEGIMTEDEIDALDKQLKKEVKAAVKFADDSAYPDTDEIWTHVYAD